LASKGVINGTSDTTFTPQADITRADFMILLVKALGLTAEVTSNFDDVSEKDYYYEYVGIAKELGITTGVGNNKFNPKAIQQMLSGLQEKMLKDFRTRTR